MFDTVLRRHLAGPLDRVAALLDRAWITPDRLTLLGLVVGLTSAVTAAGQLWLWSLACWLASRVLDGLDGPLARRRAAAARADRSGSSAPVGSEAGGFLDITADFTVYGATVVGVAVGTAAAAGPEHTWGSWLPFLAVLLAYYVNGTAFLAFSSIAERTGHRLDDGRSFSFLAGLTEGAETVAVHSLWLLLPGVAPQIAWVWAVLVGLSGAQRIVAGYRTLRAAPRPPTST